MIEEEEVYRRVRRLLELPPEQRPARVYTLNRLAGLDHRGLLRIKQGHQMRPERLRRLARVLELLEDDRLSHIEAIPSTPSKYKHIKIKRDAAPPCQAMMVLDLTGARPRMVPAFVNPNTLPELAITRVRK